MKPARERKPGRRSPAVPEEEKYATRFVTDHTRVPGARRPRAIAGTASDRQRRGRRRHRRLGGGVGRRCGATVWRLSIAPPVLAANRGPTRMRHRRHRPGRSAGERVDRSVGAGAGQCESDGPPDAPSAAGDQGDPPREVIHGPALQQSGARLPCPFRRRRTARRAVDSGARSFLPAGGIPGADPAGGACGASFRRPAPR
jgi:hypothetical protein